jgi:CheY-like chemotaxis protein
LEPAQFTLLVVDDNEENRDLLSRRLAKKGFSVLLASSGEEALRAVSDKPVDLVLLDIMMPGLSGIDVLKELRAKHSAAELPVIMTTAKTDSEDVVEALDLGANDYVTKPIDFPVVLARVQAQLRQKTARRAQQAAEAAAAVSRALGGEIRPGAVVAERYRLEAKIGSGAFGTVYRATHLELSNPVAIKVLQTGVETAPDALSRFRREGVTACRVRHPNAVSVLDFGVTDAGTAYLVMELLEGESLYDELRRKRSLSPARCVEVLVPVCEALAAAHKSGVIHRDIKPSNIFLHRVSGAETVKVLDFGIAKIASDAAMSQHLTVDGSILGTPAYMAPERLRKRRYDGKCDVYSVGVVLFQLLEGRLPFASSGDPMALVMAHLNDPVPPLSSVAPEAREPMRALIEAALTKSPDKRPSAERFAARLRSALAELLGAAASAAPPPAPPAPVFETLEELEIVSAEPPEDAPARKPRGGGGAER